MRTALLFLVSAAGYSQSYRVGEVVEVLVEDVWFDAYVQEIDGKKLRLNYSRTSDETDFWVKEDKVRKKGGTNNGSGSISFEQTTGAAPHKTDKPKDKDKDKSRYTATTTKLITLHNTCSRKETFVIDEVRYEVEGYKKIELEINVGTSIYSLKNNEKVILGKVTNSITTFRPMCN